MIPSHEQLAETISPLDETVLARWIKFLHLRCIKDLSTPEGLSNAIELLRAGAGWRSRKRDFKRKRLDEWDMLLVLSIDSGTTDWLIANQDVSRFPGSKHGFDHYDIPAPAFQEWLHWAAEQAIGA